MNVKMISSSDLYGGAGIAAYRLFQGLREIGAAKEFLAQNKGRDDEDVLGPEGLCRLWGKALPLLDQLPKLFYPQRRRGAWSCGFLPNPCLPWSELSSADIIHLHWVGGGMIPLRDFKRVASPIVWTMHDMWPFTGGCHYAYDCHSYRNACGNCPVLASAKEVDLSRRGWLNKRAVMQALDVAYVAPSRWLAEACQSSSLTEGKRVVVIPNGIDTSIFKPLNRLEKRKELGLPLDKKLIMFSAFNALGDRRKGFEQLENALLKLELAGLADSFDLVIVGSPGSHRQLSTTFQCHHLGCFTDEASLAKVYASVDLFVAPSLQDNFPNTVLEAMACGTPCVAFNVGGMSDLVDHGVTGYLARSMDVEDLALGITTVLKDCAVALEMSAASRRKVKSKFSIAEVAQRYKELYQEVLSVESMR